MPKVKKSLKGFAKTRHFIERQKQRKVTDQAVVNAIRYGELTENEHGHSFLLGTLRVTVDAQLTTLITVHPGDQKTLIKKVLGKEQALELYELIASKLKAKTSEKTDEFTKYVTEFSVKKI